MCVIDANNIRPGVTTGNCSNSNNPSKPGTCLIKAWCPVEDENDTLTLVSPCGPTVYHCVLCTIRIFPHHSELGPKVTISSFTVLIKNSVSFPNLDKNFVR